MSQNTIKTGVLIPLLRALATGALAACFIVSTYNLAQGATIWRIFWVVLSSISLAAWLLVIQRDRPPVETVQMFHDTVEPITPVQIIEDNGAYPAGQYLDLPVDRDRMTAIAMEIQNGASFSHSLAGPGRLLSRGEYQLLRDYMLQRGLLKWNSNYSRKEGVSLTGKGRALIRGLATPLPSGNGGQPQLVEYAHSTHRADKGGKRTN